MIPVLILPVYSRFDLFERMLASIDHEVDQAIVFDNSHAGLPQLEYPCRTTVIRGVTSFGYGGSINLGIMQTPVAPWWLWVSNDVMFHPGTLAQVADQMETSEPRIVTGNFTWGALNRALVEKVGLIDEWNLFPIYYDDNDYQRRCVVAGVEWIEYGSEGSTHEEGGSVTIRADPLARQANNVTFRANRERYRAKWGGDPHKETFDTPWDGPHEVSYLRFNLDARAQAVKAWGH